MVVPENIDWSEDPYWRRRRLTPAQLLVYDVNLEPWKPGVSDPNGTQAPWLEINETFSSSLIDELREREVLSNLVQPEQLSNNRQEQAQLKLLADEYGWMNCLRNRGLQKELDDPAGYRKVRWMQVLPSQKIASHR
jgi:hypothetical protein